MIDAAQTQRDVEDESQSILAEIYNLHRSRGKKKFVTFGFSSCWLKLRIN